MIGKVRCKENINRPKNHTKIRSLACVTRVFADDRLNSYAVSLKGIRRMRHRLQNKLNRNELDLDVIYKTTYRIELLNIIEGQFLSILGKYNRTYQWSEKKYKPRKILIKDVDHKEPGRARSGVSFNPNKVTGSLK